VNPLVDLSEIKHRVVTLATLIKVDSKRLPTFGHSRDFGYPHIEVDALYHFVVIERGVEIERRSTSNLDELLFWVFESVTFGLASDFELSHRKDGEDSRRQLFSKQVELMNLLSFDWANRLRDQIRRTVRLTGPH